MRRKLLIGVVATALLLACALCFTPLVLRIYRAAQYVKQAETVKAADSDKAIELYVKALALNPRKPRYWQELVDLFQDPNQEDLGFCLNGVKHGDMIDAWYYLGNYLKEKEQFGRAIFAYQQTLRYKPWSVWGEFYMGYCFGKLGQTEEEMNAYRRAIELVPNSEDAHYNLGCCFQDAKKYSEAISEFRKAALINPKNDDVWNNLGSSYSDNHQLKEALDAYKQFAALLPDDPRGAFNLSVTWYNHGNYLRQEAVKNGIDENLQKSKREEAAAAYQEAIKISPDYVKAWTNLGLTYLSLERYDEAIAAETKALGFSPDHIVAINVLGACFFRQNKFEDAIAAFKKVISLDRNNNDAWRCMGLVQRSQGKFELALQSLETALDVDPKDAQAYMKQGSLFALMGDKDHSRQAFEKAAKVGHEDEMWDDFTTLFGLIPKLDPQKLQAITTSYGVAPSGQPSEEKFFKMQDHLQESEAYFRNEIKQDPKNARAYLRLGLTLVLQGKKKEARHEFQMAISQPHSLEMWDDVGSLSAVIAASKKGPKE